jgi:hypothetical protein
MSRTIRLLMFTCVLVAASQYAATSSAKANMLNLLCYMNLNPNNLMNYWIDFDNHTITNEIFNKQNLGAPRAHTTWPVQITATSFNFYGGVASAIIDRTTGISTWYYSNGTQIWTCSVGNTPFPAPPATKF